MNPKKYANLGMLVAIGFGQAGIYKNGLEIYREDPDDESYGYLSEFEEMAKLEPEAEWKCVIYGPLWGATWLRVGDNLWEQIESNRGFA